MEAGSGNGYVVITGIFEPGSVVDLLHVSGPDVLRAEGGETVGRRVSDENEAIGFDGLIEGEHYFATGYSRGRLEERRCVAHGADDVVAFIQQPVQESPLTLGTAQTAPEDTGGCEVPEAAEPANEPPPDAPADAPAPPPLEEGIPEGVTSPVIPEEPAAAPEEVPTEPAPAEPPAVEAPPDAAPPEPPPEPEPAPAPDTTPAPVEPEPPAQTPPSEDIHPEDVSEVLPSEDPATPSEPAEPPALAEAPPAETPAEPPATVADSEAAIDVHDQLVAQAQQLAIPGAGELADDALRAAISEKNVTPVA